MLKLLRIQGRSMAPSAEEGDFILIHNFFNIVKSKPGDWFVFFHPSFGILLKECVTIDKKKNFYRFRSLNTQGLSEKEMGNIPFSEIRGKVCWHISG